MPYHTIENKIGGKGGIRTHGPLPVTRFRVEHIRPLCHLSCNLTASIYKFSELMKIMCPYQAFPIGKGLPTFAGMTNIALSVKLQLPMITDKFQIYTEGDDLYQDMLDCISRAKKSILLESYIFEPDETGKSFIDALLEKASAGVEVRIHLDAFGSLNLSMSKELDRIKKSNIHLKWYNAWCWYRPLKFNHRNHRKLLVIDESIAWLGGFNIHDENSLSEFGKERWLDTHARIDGPLAANAQKLFEQLWDKSPLPYGEIGHDLESVIVSNVNWRQRRQFRQILINQIKTAKKQIWLCTPYFMPDRFLQIQIINAARRGVDVRLLLPYKTDRPVARWVARAAYHSLISSGVRIFEYSPRFLHSKIMLIDDQWTTIGSTNIDYRSFFINLEINLMSSDISLIESLSDIYKNNLSVSEEISTDSLVQNKIISAIYIWLGRICRRIL